MEGDYSIEVRHIGAYSSSMTASSWVAPASPHTFQLWIGTTKYDVQTDDTSASGVAAAINAKAGGVVRATAANVGSAGTPDWRISLQSTALTDVSLQIKDNGVALQDQETLGVHRHNAKYVVNNSGKEVTRRPARSPSLGVLTSRCSKATPAIPSRSRSLARPGSSRTRSRTSPMSITRVDQLNQQRGTSNGALAGQSLLYQLTNKLRGLATYCANGEISGLADLGFSLGADGKLTFDDPTLTSADASGSAAINAFLGSADTLSPPAT